MPLFALLTGSALPLLVSMSVWVYLLGLEPRMLVDTFAFRAYTLLFVALLVTRMLKGLVKHPVATVISGAGILLLLVQGVSWYGFSFNGTAAVGSGEQVTDFYQVKAGNLVKLPRLPVRVTEVVDSPPKAVLVLDGVEHSLKEGEAVTLNDFAYRLIEVVKAPLLSVESAQGVVVDQVYAKTAGSEYLMIGRLPHRFYIKLLKGGESPRYGVKIVRDKLTILDKKLEPGEKVYFDGHYVSCGPGAPWAKLVVEKKQPRWLLYPGLALLVTGGLLGWRSFGRKSE